MPICLIWRKKVFYLPFKKRLTNDQDREELFASKDEEQPHWARGDSHCVLGTDLMP